MSRSASAAPRSPATVENRTNIGVCLPILLNSLARVKRVMSCVTVKVPWAPQPFACIRRSGITSRSKWAIFSISQISCSSAGPRGPAVMMLVLSATGVPAGSAHGVQGWIRGVIGSQRKEEEARGHKEHHACDFIQATVAGRGQCQFEWLHGGYAGLAAWSTARSGRQFGTPEWVNYPRDKQWKAKNSARE